MKRRLYELEPFTTTRMRRILIHDAPSVVNRGSKQKQKTYRRRTKEQHKKERQKRRRKVKVKEERSCHRNNVKKASLIYRKTAVAD
ncbi:hypothetical protein CEXT_327661 [Caerostris extrusa]|uniref:Uncharacterized protein n=1 Tax=Caerostris extrusa TaxID=172846 RepID=A0AAV4YAD8_CAEEX|nr:hypothetical protein CEXT_327661 [Caerostris extrusa]